MTESSAASEAVIPWSLLRIVLFLIALSSPPISRTPDPELFVSVVCETVAFRTSRRAMAAPDWLPIRVPITVWFLPPVIRRPAPPPERRRPSVITTFSTPVSSTRWNRTGRDQFVTRRFLTVTFESERPVKLIPPEPRLAATIGFEKRTLSRIEREYVQNGKVRVVFKDFPFIGEGSRTAALAAHCVRERSSEQVFLRWHRAVFDSQGKENSGWASKDSLVG